ncbi:MAG TPA: Holliday junction branch migration protein RuvA [Alphaproteobacteria bacterium]|nr:Holliday junction branch migration protein RuvA [Micavibrio sp.]MBK9563041.1 Holliday junction branch migration protein RuvA [Micavibrio sp.]HQX28043.1 Holliday junction branch migration protein RuvA [Alphaproteobacteria bacterium]
MIGKLSGIIDSFADNHAILDVNGVGYVVFASRRTLGRIGQPGDPATLLIDTHVREDHIHLYGFADVNEQKWFRLLTSVQGVGAKVALSILTACPAERLGVIIASQDKGAITSADGVGPKLGVRILTELKDKAEQVEIIAPSKSVKYKEIASEPKSIDQDAVSALVNLGYPRSDAYGAVMQARTKANDNDKENLQTIIRMALKELSA